MAQGWKTHQFAVHYMPPLDPLDVCDYIGGRLNSAGSPEAVFSRPARVVIGELARGSFRTTNLLCQMSLALAKQRSATFVDEEVVQAAYAAMDICHRSRSQIPITESSSEATSTRSAI